MSGSSGGKPRWVGGCSLSEYPLSLKEINSAIKQVNPVTLKVQLQKWYTTDSNGKQVRCKTKRYDLLERSDIADGDYMKCLDILRKMAEEKFKKMNENRTKTYSFLVNDVLFQYTAVVQESLSDYSESLSYGYYFYDKNGNYLDALNYGALYG